MDFAGVEGYCASVDPAVDEKFTRQHVQFGRSVGGRLRIRRRRRTLSTGVRQSISPIELVAAPGEWRQITAASSK